MKTALNQKIFLGFASASGKGLALSTFVMASLLVCAQHAQAERDREFVEVDGKKYCFGFDRNVDFYWPGPGSGQGGKGLKPGETHKNGYEMGQWPYDDQAWWAGYTQINKDRQSVEKELAQKLAKNVSNSFFVWTTGSGNQPNGFVGNNNKVQNKAGYLENPDQPAGATYNYFGSPSFTQTEGLYVAYKCNIESNVPESVLGYKLSDVIDGVVNPVFKGGTLYVETDAVSGLDFALEDVAGNAIHNNGYNLELKGVFSGDGGIILKGGGITTFSGNNVYAGATTIQEGTLKLGSATGVPRASATTIKVGGTLDLNSQSPFIDSVTLDGGAGSGTVAEILESTAKIQGGALFGAITSKGGLISGVTGADLNVKSGRTFLRDESSLGTVNVTGGQLWAADDDRATVTNLTLNMDSFEPDDRRNSGRTLTADVQDGLVLGFDNVEASALKVTGKFTYTDGNVYLYKPAGDAGKDYEGAWNVIEFSDDDLSDEQYEELFANTYLMYETPDGDLEYFQFAADGSPADADLLREVSLKKGSLKVEVGELDLSKPNPGGNGGETIEDEIEDEIIDEIDAAGDGGGTIDLDDGSLEEIGDEFEIFIKEELVGVVTHGLLPLNVDGPGQTLATYNNVLADTIFERTPMRQLIEVEPAVAADPTPEPEVIPAAGPVQGLWSKASEVDDQEANAFLAEQTASIPLVVADAHTLAEHQSENLIEINGKSYAENESLTAEYAERDGVRGWFRGFGSNSADSNGESSTVFNPYSISSGGGVVGVDVSLSETFQLGAYANYGNTNLWQRSGVKGMSGSWESDGWGGGVTADYWSENFYVQGLIGGTGFSGQQKRSIKGYGAFFDDQTASGEKSATSVVGALRLGAPFQSGSTYFEPQFTATWTGNNENRFSESTSDDQLALTYKSRTTNYLQTALGMKVAWPMKTGTTGLLTPSVKVAWLGDWDMGNEDQKIGFAFTNKGYAVSSNQENVNGALIEAGLDYSVVKVEGTTVKAYLRGGAEVWGGERGTQWRASGGVTFQF